MPKRPEDPIRNYQRRAVAARRKAGQSCKCGESRPEALIAGSAPTICAACSRKRRGQSVLDAHHPAGSANHRATVPIPVNDHRAILSDAQYDWPRQTWENPSGSPIIAGAACIRGYCETTTYLLDAILLWIVEMLEELDGFLKKRLGPDWWRGTEMEKFMPKPKPKR